MRKNIINFLVGAVAVVAIVFAATIVIDGRSEIDSGSGAGGAVANAGNSPDITGASPSAIGNPSTDGSPDATPDDSFVSQVTVGDDKTVENKVAGYSFTMPSNWYLEPVASSDLAVYPDYDPTSGEDAACKIEISALPATAGTNASNLNAWITTQLHEDPTADVSEDSRTTITVGSASAVQWQGSLNGVSTTLVYALGASGTVLEFAPSTLSAPTDPDADDCTLELQGLLANFQFASDTN